VNKRYSPAVPSERSFRKASLLLLSFRETMVSDAMWQFIVQVLKWICRKEMGRMSKNERNYCKIAREQNSLQFILPEVGSHGHARESCFTGGNLNPV